MKRPLVTLAMVVVVLAGACVKNASNPSATVTGLVVSGNGTFTTRNDTSQLTATANLSGGTTQNVSSTATWSSSNSGVASVSSSGLVTAVALGSATITAAYQGSSGSMAIAVKLKATPTLTPVFTRLCVPFRAKLQVTIAETSNNIGFDVTSMTLTMKDIGGVIRATRAYTAADLTAALGSNHFNAGQSRVLIYEAAYPGNVDTMDSTATALATVTDDAGNTQTITVPVTFQHDGC